MAGLVAQAEAPIEEAPAAETGEGESNLTPEEQEAYDAAMKMVGAMLYDDDESNQAIMDLMKNGQPAEIAEASIFLLSKIEETFQGEYPADLIVITADEISDLLLELVDESGIVKVDEALAIETKNMMVEELAEEYGADPEDLQAALGDITEEDVAAMQTEMGGQNA